jgi:hypothetical protein
MIAEALDDISPSVRAEAACNDLQGSLAGVYFSEELQDIAAGARREPWGVWGGHMFVNGRILATKRRKGRPSKVLRAEDQLPEIPVPVHLRQFLRSA